MSDIAKETQEALNYLRETVLELVESKDDRIAELEAQLQNERALNDEMDRDLSLAKAKIEELAPTVYGEAA
jgi:hypothetical protein